MDFQRTYAETLVFPADENGRDQISTKEDQQEDVMQVGVVHRNENGSSDKEWLKFLGANVANVGDVSAGGHGGVMVSVGVDDPVEELA